ncbi:hypothetical protein V8E36_005181 [Tilletia maclaganii]
MTPSKQDIRVFEIAGTLFFGPSDYTIGSAGEDLRKTGLAPFAWSGFFSAMEEAPATFTSAGESLWISFRTDPTAEAHQALLRKARSPQDVDQAAPSKNIEPSSSTQKSAPAASRGSSAEASARADGRELRARKAPSYLSRYHTDDDEDDTQTKKKRRTATTQAKGKAKENAPSIQTRPSERQAGRSHLEDDPAYNSDEAELGPRRSPRKHPAHWPPELSSEEEDNVVAASSRSSESPMPPTPASIRQASTSRLKLPSSAKASASTKSKKPTSKTQASKKVPKKSNRLLVKASEKALSRAELRQMRNAKLGVEDEEDRSFSESDGEYRELTTMSNQSLRTQLPARLATTAADTKAQDEGALDGIGQGASGPVSADKVDQYFKFLSRTLYIAHPTNKSNLALHLNPRSNQHYCKRLYDPIDKRFAGHFQKPTQVEAQNKAAVVMTPPSARASPLSDGSQSVFGQPRLDAWRAGLSAQQLTSKIEEVRQLILEWVVIDNQPFTEPSKSDRFRAILFALCRDIEPALTSPRTIGRDLGKVHINIVNQLVTHLKTHSVRFAVSHDAWTSPSRRYSFIAFVVSCVDVDWSFKQSLLAFEVFQSAHTGAALAGTLIRVLSEHLLVELWNGVLVGDAASANGRMSSALEYDFGQVQSRQEAAKLEGLAHRREDHAIFCFNHALHRAMLDFYKSIGVKVDGVKKTLTARLDAARPLDRPDQGSDSDRNSDSEWDSSSEHESGGEENEDEDGEAGAEHAGTSQQLPHDDQDAIDDINEAEETAQFVNDMHGRLPPIMEEDEDQSSADADRSHAARSAGGIIEDLGAPLNKIAALVKQIHSSSEALREFKRLMRMHYGNAPTAKERKLAQVTPTKFNSTRWNSRHSQMRTALRIRSGLLFYVKNSDRPAVTAVAATHRRGGVEGSSIEEGRGGLEQMQAKLGLYQEVALASKSLLLAAVLHPRYRLTTFTGDYPDHVEKVKALLKEEVQRFTVEAPAGSTAPSSKKTAVHKEPAIKSKWQRPEATVGDHVISASHILKMHPALRSAHRANGIGRAPSLANADQGGPRDRPANATPIRVLLKRLNLKMSDVPHLDITRSYVEEAAWFTNPADASNILANVMVKVITSELSKWRREQR